MEYKKGDKVWFIPNSAEIAILCTIDEVDDEFRKIHPDSYLFYWIDEPVGHALAEDEMIAANEVSIEEVKEILEDCKEQDKEQNSKKYNTLEEYRERTISFIKGTWERNGCGDKWIDTVYLDKEYKKEWIN